ncbi:MAG: DUF4157 domain-containing protein [Deltaproteobacteria bacterium]|nr:DUF4157 domain-containing protein [Deltaproteobacteria bacterium]
MRMPEPGVQRQPIEDEEEEQIQTKPVPEQITPLVPKQVEEEEELQMKVNPSVIQHQEPEEDEILQGKMGEIVQRQPEEEEELLQAKFTSGLTGTLQTKTEASQNRTGMPDHLKSGLENLSGIDLSSVHVHHNSSKPAQLNALAYTQGQDIHVGPRQEKHIPHEGWHAVQQMQGRVKPTMQAKGRSINDDKELEREADVMGAKALQITQAKQATISSVQQGESWLQWKVATNGPGGPMVQRQIQNDPGPFAGLSAAGERRWQQVYSDWGSLLTAISKAMVIWPTPSRRLWSRDLHNVGTRLGLTRSDADVDSIATDLKKLHNRVYKQSEDAAEAWFEVDDRYKAEAARLMSGSGAAGLYALQYLRNIHAKTQDRITRFNYELMVKEDFIKLSSTLEGDGHIWFGELVAARRRVKDLKDMLYVIAEIRVAGKDEDKIVPGWHDRVWAEVDRLHLLWEAAPTDNKATRKARSRALDAKPRDKGYLEKFALLLYGAGSALVSPFIEAGKQAIDLGQIYLHFRTFGQYKPKLISGTAQAAPTGAWDR